VPFERDPLSPGYDLWARQLVGRAFDDPYMWRTGRVISPGRDPVDSGGLSRHERAAQRSLYYVMNLDFTPRAAPKSVRRGAGAGRDWSLQVDWGTADRERQVLGVRFGRRVRYLLVRVVSYRAARRAAARNPDAYVFSPGERSRGLTYAELEAGDWQPKQGYQAG